jgi:lipid A 4'-phosphatase
MVPTVWTDVDLTVAQFFAGPAATLSSASWLWVELINLYVPMAFRSVILVALGAWLVASLSPGKRHWRMQLAFLVLAGALGPGLLVNAGFKDNWQRARPYQVEEFGGPQKFTRAGVMTDQCNNNCSFVSGHAACGFFWASLALVRRNRRFFWTSAGIVAGVTIGFARMSDSAHWLSDVLWACPITLLCSWTIWKILLLAYPSRPSMSGAAR